MIAAGLGFETFLSFSPAYTKLNAIWMIYTGPIRHSLASPFRTLDMIQYLLTSKVSSCQWNHIVVMMRQSLTCFSEIISHTSVPTRPF